MPPSRRVVSNGRSPLVSKQSQITTFFTPGKNPRSSPNPNPNTSKENKKKTPLTIHSPSNANPKTPPTDPNPKAPSTAKAKSYAEEVVGRKIRVFWPPDKTWYEGNVKSFDKLTGKHLIQYEDGEEEVLDIEKEKIEFVEDEAPRKLLKLRRMSTMEEKDGDDGDSDDDGDANGDSDDEGRGKGMEKNVEEGDTEEVELVDVEEEVVVKRSRSGSGRSSCAGAGKRKKVDLEKLGCSKKFSFDGEGGKGCSPLTLVGKSRSCVGLTTENGLQFENCGSNITGAAAERFASLRKSVPSRRRSGHREPNQEQDHGIESQEAMARELFPEDKDYLPEYQRPLLMLTDNGFSGVDDYARKMSEDIFKWVNGPYITWRQWPNDVKRQLYEKFRNKFSFLEGTHENKIFKAYNMKAGDLYRKRLWGWRRSKLGKNDLYNWDKLSREENRPSWISAENWTRMIEIWSGDKWKCKSTAARGCRSSRPERNIYTGGSITMEAHERRLARQLDRMPTQMDVFYRTKTRVVADKPRFFANEHDRQIYEDYRSFMLEHYGEDESRWPYVDPEGWMKAAHTPSPQNPKPRIYGYGEARDTNVFFPDGTPRGRRRDNSTRSSQPFQPSERDSRMRTIVREEMTAFLQELQRSGKVDLPCFTPSSSRARTEGEGDN